MIKNGCTSLTTKWHKLGGHRGGNPVSLSAKTAVVAMRLMRDSNLPNMDINAKCKLELSETCAKGPEVFEMGSYQLRNVFECKNTG